MSKNPRAICNQVYTCNGCQKKCNLSVKKQHEIYYRPAINNRVIYDYKTPNGFYERYDTLCFTPQKARELVYYLIQLCTNIHNSNSK